jgi:hypothetical protein
MPYRADYSSDRWSESRSTQGALSPVVLADQCGGGVISRSSVAVANVAER